MKFEEYNEDNGRNEFASHLNGECNKYSALQSLLSGEQLSQDEVESLKEFKVVQKFLDTPFGDAVEAKFKKVFAAATIAANDKGTLPFSLDDKSPISIVSAIDEGLNRVKVAYQLAQEELDPIEATDLLIDEVASRVITVADKVIETDVPVLLDVLCAAVARVCPPAIAFAPVIKSAERFLVPAAKKAVRRGLAIVTDTAKSAVRSTVKAAKKLGNKLRCLLPW